MKGYVIAGMLTPQNKEAGLKFALEHLNDDWSNVVFTDKKTFKTSQHGYFKG